MRYCTYDIETTGFDPRTDKIFSYCIGHENGDVEVRRVDGASRKKNWKRLERFFADTSIAKIAHNYKFELSFMHHSKIDVPRETVWEDTMLMSQLLRNNAKSHALENLAWELCGWSTELDHRVKQAGKELGSYDKIPVPLMTEYQKADGIRPMILFKTWKDDIFNNEKLYRDYRNEIRLVETTLRIEEAGMTLHRKNAERLVAFLQRELDSITAQTRDLFGEYINLNSAKQVERILYKQLRLPILGYTKTGKPAVDKDVLMELREKFDQAETIIDLILQCRSYTTGVSIVKGYIALADEDGYIRPTILTNQARTGRESSRKPNLQNVAKEEVLKNPFPVPARKCFRAPVGHVLLFADYSGQEIRLIADLSQDEEMVRLLREGADIHAEAAKEWYGDRFTDLDIKDPEWKTLRSACKNATFGCCYGAGVGKLAATLGVSVVRAKEGYGRFAQRFPRAAGFSGMMSAAVRENGYVETPFGRRLYIPPEKCYIGANYIIQGTAAGMIKRAQNNIDEYLLHHWDGGVRLLIPIHDETIIRVNRKLLPRLERVCGDISDCMTNIDELTVPMEAEWRMATTTWDKAEEMQ